ncbi:hypothetical protein ZIOFF_009512 [Zingiber officinale]|uniref:Uncharacterized protein n=1 Tax=Zingiber officinale TaxID=94328 RepID=A0A8J5HHT0_ZINOF|nr:hypothetical protein ZIOFF_009512 [Zingiber officinale]
MRLVSRELHVKSFYTQRHCNPHAHSSSSRFRRRPNRLLRPTIVRCRRRSYEDARRAAPSLSFEVKHNCALPMQQALFVSTASQVTATIVVSSAYAPFIFAGTSS